MVEAGRFDAILFDADGVLQRAPSDLWTRLAAVVGANDPHIGLCIDDVFAAEAPCLIGEASFAETIIPVLTKWRSRVDVAAFLAAWLTIEVDRGVLDLVAELRAAGLHCAIASNQEANRAHHMSETLGYREAFDAEFYSCDLACRKPTLDFFAAVVARGGFVPARTLFIDDRADNVAGAEAAGLAAAQFVLGKVGEGAAPLRTLLVSYGLGSPA